jgi:hypothetical protein
MPLSNRQDKFETPISTQFSPSSLLCRTLQPTQVQNRVLLALPPKTEHQNVSKQQFISQIPGFSDHKPTEGGLFGNISGYSEVSVGGIWGIAEDATLGVEIAGVARSLRA